MELLQGLDDVDLRTLQREESHLRRTILVDFVGDLFSEDTIRMVTDPFIDHVQYRERVFWLTFVSWWRFPYRRACGSTGLDSTMTPSYFHSKTQNKKEINI
jgi:hypothetical protein